MREQIEKKYEAIRQRIDSRGLSDGTMICTDREAELMVAQAACDGILLYVNRSPSIYQNGDEVYYYYNAMSANEEKERVSEFVDNHIKMTVYAVNEMIPIGHPSNLTPENQRKQENLVRIRRLLQARDRRRRRRREEEQLQRAEYEEECRIEADREEAADHRDDLEWLVRRIESLGWKVWISRKENL